MGLFDKFRKNKEKQINGQNKLSNGYEGFCNWLDPVLSFNDIEKAVAFNFNIYEDSNNQWSLELVGTSQFSTDDSDWACAEIFATRSNPFKIIYIGSWQEVLALFKEYVGKYLEIGTHREVLKSKSGVGIGFVDGDLELLYEKIKTIKNSNKRKTLGADFQKLVDSKDDEVIIAFLKRCELNACGGAPKRSALGFNLSKAVMKWLIEQGADVNFPNSLGATPLHYHARKSENNIKYLIELGADINAKDKMGNTPLSEAVDAFQFENIKALVESGADINVIVHDRSLIMIALKRTFNISITTCVEIVEYLLEKGVKLTGEEEKEVTRIGKDFEFQYEKISLEIREGLEEGLQRLYKLFNVIPVPKRKKQNLNEPIKVIATRWQKQHDELWNLLVSPSGKAETIQGEVIRISGKLSYEILDNGRMNWDEEYVKMTNSMLDYFKQGTIQENEFNECASILEKICKDKADETELARLSELSVRWVLHNSMPMILKQVPYNR